MPSVRRAHLTGAFAGLLALAGFAVTMLLFRAPDVHSSLAVLSLAFSLELLAVPILLRGGRYQDLAGAMVVGALVGLLAVMAYLAGGLNQPILGLFVAVPVIATVLLSPRAGLFATLTLIGVVSLFLGLQLSGYVPQFLVASADEASLMRGLILLLGTILAAAAVWTYESRTQSQLERYRAQNQRDVVSGLPNRWQFEIGMREQLNDAGAHIGYACLMLIDIDHFRQFNALYGRASGDELLRRVGAAIQSSAVGPHCLVSRLESDCFALFCWCASKSTIRTIYDRVQLLVSACAAELSQDQTAVPSVSIGIGLFNESDCARGDAAGLLHAQAAEALLAAQALGGNKVKFHAAAA